MLATVSDSLKCPLHFCAQKALGGCLPIEPDDPSTLGSIARKIDSVAAVIFYSLLCVAALPVWFVGDTIEWINVGNQPFEDPTKPIKIEEPITLDVDKTKYMGASLSTYQYSADPNYCDKSDWGTYCEKNFKGEDAEKGPGQGVDILTEEGRELLAATLFQDGSNTLRISVEWADVLNEDGTFNDVAMQKYVEAAKYFRERNIELFITLHHFVTPLDEDGNSLFESASNIDKFVDYAKYVYTHLKPYATKFVTFNEPNVNGVQNYILGNFPAKGIGNFWKHTHVVRNMLEAHNRVHRELHKMAGDDEIDVGLTHQALRFMPSSRFNYLARIISFIFTYVFHESFMQWAEKNKKTLDFVGVQYYTMPLIGGIIPDSTCRKDEKMVEAMHFRFHPQGLLPILEEVAERLGDEIPLLVTETGTAGPNSVDEPSEMDDRRREYMEQSLAAFRKAQERLNLIGYLYWGIFQNFEWNHGYGDQDFGMYVRKGNTGHRLTGGAMKIKEVFERTRDAITTAAVA